MLTAPLLGANLDNAFVFLGRVDHRSALDDVVRQPLFAIDVLAISAGADQHVSVPVIGRADDDGIKVFALDDFAKILLRLNYFSGPIGFLDIIKRLLDLIIVRITQADDLDSR